MLSRSNGTVGLAIALVAILVISCSGPAADETTMIGPGDTIGAMTVEQGSHDKEDAWIWDFCKFIKEGPEPDTQIVECAVPQVPVLAIGFGWGADESRIASNWDEMTYELYIDDQRVNLDQFEWEERSNPDYGSSRGWVINLVNPSAGQHSFRYQWSAEEAIDDGFDVYAPGVYEHIVNFTVGE